MAHRISTHIKRISIVVFLSTGPMVTAMPACAADNNAVSKSDYAQAAQTFAAYRDIVPMRDLRGAALDPKLTDKQADQFRTDSYNDTEKKLAVMRQKLLTLNKVAVEKMLHGQMKKQDPNDPDNLMCALEIVARIYPQEYAGYAELIKPGVDESGFVRYIKDTFLGKNAALHEDPDPTLK